MWIKLDDGFATHPKIMAAGAIPALIQVRAICYASQHKTDGFIPASAVILLLSGLDEVGIDLGRAGEFATFGCQANEIEWAPKMVEYGLWEVRAGGYYVHDYLDWNLSKREYEAFINKKRKAGKKGMKARWGKDSPGITHAITPAITDDITKSYHPTSTSISTLNPLHSSESGPNLKSNSETKEFEQFWLAYPKKVGKKEALKAFEKAKDKPPLVDILQAIETSKRSEQWMKENGQFIPNPSTWLNQGRWLDQPSTNGHGKSPPPPFPPKTDPIARGQWRTAYGDPRQYGYEG